MGEDEKKETQERKKEGCSSNNIQTGGQQDGDGVILMLPSGDGQNDEGAEWDGSKSSHSLYKRVAGRTYCNKTMKDTHRQTDGASCY